MPTDPSRQHAPDIPPRTIGEAFERQARAHPDRDAVRTRRDSFTYARLDARANGIGIELLDRIPAPAPGELPPRIGIVLEPGPAETAAVLGVLKAGCIAVPLDHRGPAQGIRSLLDDAAVALVIAVPAGAPPWLPPGLPVLDPSTVAESVVPPLPKTPLSPESPAMIVYTSGSTGRPKGVVRSHRNLLWVAEVWAHETAHIGPCGHAFVSGLQTGNGNSCLFRSLLTGGTVLRFDPGSDPLDEFGDWLRSVQAGSITLPASFFRQFLATLPAGSTFPSVQLVRLGSEEVLAADFEGFRRHFPADSHLANTISSTETGNISQLRLGPDANPAPGSLPLGTALPGVALEIVDETGAPVPPGVPGELVVRSPGVALGYWKAATRSLSPLPGPDSPAGTGAYRTGDLAVRAADGTLAYVGRIDHRLKIRGLGVSPESVEAALATHPAIRRAGVSPRQHGQAGVYLVAFIECAPGEVPEPAELRSHLRHRLPDPAIPSLFIPVTQLPLGARGKLDRAQLAAMPVPEPSRTAPAALPETPAERLLASLWQEILRVDPVGVDDDFFELGGHSLAALRILSRLHRTRGIRLDVSAFFEAPTIRRMARLLGQDGPGSAAGTDARLPAFRTGRLQLSPAQVALWTLDHIAGGTNAYNVPHALELSGPVDASVLEAALRSLVERHEPLRTVIREHDGHPEPGLLDAAGFHLVTEVIQGASDEARRTAAVDRAEAGIRVVFDLARDFMLRALLLRFGTDRHLLVLTFHHIAFDRWSAAVFARDLSELYAAHKERRPPTLPPLPATYSDHAAWKQEILAAPRLDELRRFWRDHLEGVPLVLDLPQDHPRGRRTADRVGSIPVRIAGLGAVHALARQEGATGFMVVLAAFQCLLGRLAGAEELLVGTAISGRDIPEVEDLVGYFVNVLPMRADLTGAPSFRAVLRRTRASTLLAYSHRELPFDRIVADLWRDRSPHAAPVIQAHLGYQNMPADPLVLPAVQVTRLPLHPTSVRFDLYLSLREERGDLIGQLEYDPSLFDADTPVRWLRQFSLLLEAATSNPDLPITALPLLSAEEFHRCVVEWNRTRTPPPECQCLHERVGLQARRTPEAVAITCAGESISYRELVRRSRALAATLHDSGAGPGKVVALAVERSVDAIVALLGILWSGAAYLPVDPNLPAERIAFMLEDSGAVLLVTSTTARHRMPARRPPEVPVGPIPDGEADRPLPAVTPDDLAYVIYTSGSTGQPKAVEIPHRAVVNVLVALRDLWDIRAHDRILGLATLSFDISVAEIFLPLETGATLVLATSDEARDSRILSRLIDDSAVTFVQATPTTWSLLLEEGWVPRRPLQSVAGGESLPQELASRLARLPGRAWNAYGPTETTIWSTVAPILPTDERVTVGRPLLNTRIFILDPAGHPVPVGVVGEIHIGGAGVARGYRGRPALTAERFVPDPFPDAGPGARMYRTGDLGRWLSDGTIECLGRLDGQVKLRGMRIETGEIEGTLNRHPAVAHSAVVLREPVPGSPALFAYIVPRPETPAPGPEELREWLGRSLPEHMVPSGFTPLGALPLTPSGKLDRRALPAPVPARPANPHPNAQRDPDETESILLGIWQEVLGTADVGLTDNFFALGGHSLVAVRALVRIRKRFGVEIPIRKFLESPTVAALARIVAGARPVRNPGAEVRIDTDGRSAFIPLAYTQERLWFIDRLAGRSAEYNLGTAFRLRGPLDKAALEGACRDLVARHEPLRTICREVDGVPRGVLLPAEGFGLSEVNLQHLAPAERETEAEKATKAEAGRPFDLGRDLLFRVLLLALDDDDHQVVFTQHHIASDGWSWGIVLRELPLLYAARLQRTGNPLPALPLRYQDYAAQQRRLLEGEDLPQRLAYWRRRLDGLPEALDLPLDFTRPTVSRHRGDRVRISIEGPLLSDLRTLARAEGATPFMVVAAVWSLLLSRLSRQTDLAIGIPFAGRLRQEHEALVGFFANTLVLRADLSGHPTFRELLARITDSALGAFSHQDVPFEKLVEALKPTRSLARTPLFQVALAYQTNPITRLELPALGVSRVRVENHTSKFDLTLSLEESPERIGGTLEFDSDLFLKSTAARWVQHLLALLGDLVRDPDRPVATASLLAEAERSRMFRHFNPPPSPYPSDRTIPGLFRRAAAAHAGLPALSLGSKTLDYGELDRISDRLAAHLAATGVRPGDFVALHLPRSFDLVATVLAILKAGAAYVPLPTEYPVGRLRFMLEDTAASCLVAAEELPGGLLPPACRLLDLRALSDGPTEPGLASLALREPPPSPCALPEIVDPTAPAYVLYTSGSTGRPKGVVVPHRAIARLVFGQGYATFGPGLRTLLLAPPAFDASTLELWAPLLHGGTCVVFPHPEPDPVALGSALREGRVNCLWLTAALFNHFIDTRPDILRGVAHILTGGEALSVPHVVRARELLPGTRLTNGYGPTECTTFACTHDIAPDESFPRGSVPIGRPIAHTCAVVVDASLQPVPVGVPGELLLGGDGLALGYHQLPGLTAERFIPNPFPELAGAARLYRTGDLVRWLPDGPLEFLGRIDGQVKIRGHRIELGEIEAVLLTHPAVAQATALVRTAPDGDRSIAAFVAPSPGTPAPTARRLHAFLESRLPKAAHPSVIRCLREIPRSANGKIDREALLQLADAPDDEAAPVERTLSPTEETLARIWGEVLGRASIRPDDHFFELGGHSLMAMRVLARVRAAFGIQLPVRRLFEHASLERFAAAIEEARAAAEPPAVAAPMPEPAATASAQAVPDEWNRTDAALPAFTRLDEAFAARASHAPDRTAIVEAGGETTYRSLLERAGSLREALARHGVQPGDRVAFQLRRSSDLVALALAAGMCRAVCLPLDLHWPRRRVEAICKDARPRILVTQDASLEGLDGTARVVALHQLRATPESTLPASAAGDVPFPPAPSGDLPAYVIYTSGSTGTPKGVVVGHRSLLNHMAWMERAHGLGTSGRMLWRTSPAFDASLWEIWQPLFEGACIVVGTEEDVPDPAVLVEVMDRNEVTDAQFVPALLDPLLEIGLPRPRRLRRVFVGGEALLVKHADALSRAWGVPLINLYGPTEATIQVTHFTYAAGQPPVQGNTVPIGRPVDNARIRILDDEGRQTPVGVPGELCIGGVPLAHGYLGQPGLTAERFVPDPFETGPGARLYRTGDRARWLPDGNVEFLGRIDHQIKIRGYRIEPGEIEAAAARLPGIRTVAVVRREDARGDAGVVAFFVPTDPAHPPHFVTLREQLAAVLPEYMLPSAFIAIDAMPASTSGKIDRNALAALAAPRADRPGASAPVPSAGTTRPPGHFPLSFTQERLWLIDRIEAGSGQYRVPFVRLFRGGIDARALGRALRELVARHEALRTVVDEGADGPRGRLADPAAFLFHAVDLRQLPASQRRAEARRRAEEFSALPFDLSRDLPLRAWLLDLGEGADGLSEQVLVLVFHHIAVDGWALAVAERELSLLYAAFVQGQPSPLPAPTLNYVEFAAAERQRFPTLAGQLRHWVEHLADAPRSVDLPLDRPRPEEARHAGAHLDFVVPGPLARSLADLARREGATPFMLHLAAWQALLARLTGQRDIVVGVPVAGRTTPDLEQLVGFLANTLVLRARLEGSQTFRQLLGQVTATALAGFANQEYPFEKLVEALRPGRSLSRSPLFQVAFAFQNTPDSPLRLGAGGGEPFPIGNPTSKFDLTLGIVEHEDHLALQFEFDTDLFDTATVEHWATLHLRLLEAIARNPDQPVFQLPLLPEAGRPEILRGATAPASAWPRDRNLVQLFRAACAAHADSPALQQDARAVSYAELDRVSDALAAQLGDVRPGDTVALLLPRSVDFVVGVLAILKRGAAYVPLPAEYPAARLRFMLEDSGATALLAGDDLAPDVMPPSCRLLDLRAWTHGPPRTGLRTLDLPAAPPGRPGPAADPMAPAYIMYTSGSTGQPKGVVVPHRAVVRLVFGQTYADFGPDLRTLLLAPPAFDASTFEMWAPLLHGGCCVIHPDTDIDPVRLGEVLRQHRVTSLWLTAALFNHLVDTHPGSLQGVPRVLTGGEALSVPHILRARTLLPGTRLTNGYGPTECTTFACTHEIAPEDRFPRGSVPIGRPIAHTVAVVVDEGLQPVPVGIPGELLLGGDGLALGYHRRPDLTMERFIPNPFPELSATDRLYRTGDIVRRLADGSIEFLGRVDDQVKIRGHRIEPGEVRRQLARFPGVHEAWVAARPAPSGERQLVACCQPAPGATISPADLRRHLLRSLPDYMVPAVIHVRARLPVTPNGKLDWSALGETESAPATAPQTGEPTLDEALLADLWCRLLRVPRVEPHSDFFALGGHSLLALQLVSQVQSLFRVEMTPRILFHFPTLHELASWLHREMRRPGRQRLHSPDERLLTIQGDGKRPPLFVFPGGYGDESEVISQTWMSRCHLGPEQPVYALLAPGVEGRFTRGHGIAEEASACIAEMRRVHPTGPWFLLGLCVGGNLAFEVARQLEAAGERVGMLAMADCLMPGRAHYLHHCLAHPTQGWRQWIMNTLYETLPSMRPLLTSAGRQALLARWRTGQPVPAADTEWRAYQHGEGVLRRLMTAPRGRFGGHIDLLVSQTVITLPRAHAWTTKAASSQLHRMEGNHSTYLIEGAAYLAQLYRTRMDAAADAPKTGVASPG